MTADLKVETALCSTRVQAILWRRIRQAAIEQGRTIQVVVEEALLGWLIRQGIREVVLADPVEAGKIRAERAADIARKTDEMVKMIPRRIRKQAGQRLGERRTKTLAALVEAVAPGTTGQVQGGSDGRHLDEGDADREGQAESRDRPLPASRANDERRPSGLSDGLVRGSQTGDTTTVTDTPDPPLGF